MSGAYSTVSDLILQFAAAHASGDILRADPRGVQHARSRFGDAFDADACTVVVAGWGEICASSQMREQPRVGTSSSDLSLDLSFLCSSRTDCFARL